METKKVHLALLILLLSNMALSLVVDASIYMDAMSFPASSSGGLIEDNEEMLMESESSRRVLSQSRYISYAAMNKDSIPCNRRGPSYYNCQKHAPVRPYTRGCSKFTRCGGRYN
ncbi:unnamed protein product [Cuscuta epithymum]|uniref:Rapid ALkalinization Factor n=1 Tax=Cuscuta epithymum TaxID=186058 RepID=A0AAV0DSD3_9ASTE|nr:unnamed protein product [Cuscuta epithymum]